MKKYIADTTVEGLIGIDILTLQEDLMEKHGDKYNDEISLFDNIEILEGRKVAQELQAILTRHRDKLKKIMTAMPV